MLLHVCKCRTWKAPYPPWRSRPGCTPDAPAPGLWDAGLCFSVCPLPEYACEWDSSPPTESSFGWLACWCNLRKLSKGDHIGHGATSVPIGHEDGSIGRQDFGGLGHEIHAAEKNHVGL